MEQILAAVGLGEGIAVIVAAVMTLLLRVILPRDRRGAIWLPLAMLLLHVLTLLWRASVPLDGLREALDVAGLFFLLTSMSRSGFLLVVHGLLSPRLHVPLPKIFQDIVQAAIYAVVALVTLRAAGLEPGSLLTTSALLTAVIGLSLQDTLGNMFAGLALQVQRPFQEGDWIRFDEHPEHLGKVVEMNWRAVRVLTLEQVEVTVPNSVVADAPIRNYTKPTVRVRQSAHVVAPYAVPPRRVQRLLADAVSDVPGVLGEPRADVLTLDYTERGVQYWVRYFISDFDLRERIAGEVRDRLWYALSREGIRIPAPLRDVQLQEVSPEVEARWHAEQVERREQAIRGVDFLSVLPDDARRRLAEAARRKMFAAGEFVIHEGDAGEELYIIEEGHVRVTLRRGDQETAVARLGPGEFFGEMSVMTGERRRASVRADTDATVLVIDKTTVRPVLEGSPALVRTISQVLAAREADLDRGPGSDEPSESGQSLEERTGMLLLRIKKFFAL